MTGGSCLFFSKFQPLATFFGRKMFLFKIRILGLKSLVFNLGNIWARLLRAPVISLSENCNFLSLPISTFFAYDVAD